MNPEKIIYATIIVVVILAIAGSLYPTLVTYVNNITGSGWTGTAIVAIISVLYWILVGAGIVLYFVKSFLPKFRG